MKQQSETEEAVKTDAENGSKAASESSVGGATKVSTPPSGDSKKALKPEERFLEPTKDLPLYNPARLWSWTKYILLQGVTRDCMNHDDAKLQAAHEKAIRYDIQVEYLWTYAQVASCMVMSIAHGKSKSILPQPMIQHS
jgi:solute carrier family 20 (sodium-dependent phosphate transporter)